MFRYVALVPDHRDPGSPRVVKHITSALHLESDAWQCVFRFGPLSVYAAQPPPSWIQPGLSGVILGALFHTPRLPEHARADPPVRPDPLTVDSLLREDARRLTRECWGNYVAFDCDEAARRVRVLKDPTGSLPCLHAQHAGVHVFSSHLADLKNLETHRIAVNASYVQAHVCGVASTADRSALVGVVRLGGGEYAEIDLNRTPPAMTVAPYWRAIDFCSAERRLDSPARAKEELRKTLASCTHSLTLGHGHILHRLSGGLDSSIVLACLRQAQVTSHVTSYTYYHPGSRADERPWARFTAEHLRCDHLERAFHPEEAQLTAISALQPTPTPISVLPYVQRAPLERRLCATLTASAVCCGSGGDSNLCRDSVALTAADFVHDRGLHPRLLALSAAVARHSGLAVWEVARDALAGRSPAQRRASIGISAALTRLVIPEVKEAAAQRLADHPPPELIAGPPSLVRRLGSVLLGIDFYDWSVAPESQAPLVIAPLQAQPVVELCLRIPSYIHFDRGRERGLARAAFAHDLPPAVSARCWKDRAPGFLEALFMHHRAFVREFLLEGLLVRDGLLARKALEQALSGNTPAHAVDPVEILHHLSTESWMRHWGR